MSVRQFVVDAFTTELFGGNPAAVCLLERWPDDGLLRRIAAENNLAETAFVVSSPRGFRLRWFTPTVEVDLCGHATLATAHVLFHHLHFDGEAIVFETLSGDLIVRRDGERLTMDFPARPSALCPTTPLLVTALGAEPKEVRTCNGYLAVFDSEATIRALRPDFKAIEALDQREVIVTAPGESCDFVSRVFAPRLGIDEDPVTGSAHCALTAYWAERLGRTVFFARQVSARGGEIGCELRGDRVLLSGNAVTVSEGILHIAA